LSAVTQAAIIFSFAIGMASRKVCDASVHDSQKFEDVLDASNTASNVWADSAYRSQEIEEKLGRRG